MFAARFHWRRGRFVDPMGSGVFMKTKSTNNELLMVVLIACAVGFVFFERMSINYLAGHIGLTGTQLGTLGSIFALSYSVAAVLAGKLVEKVGAKRIAVASILLLGGLSFAQSFMDAFAGLLAIRVMEGFVGGIIIPTYMAILASVSSPKRKGLNAGIAMGLVPALFSATIAPVLLIGIAERTGDWHCAYWVLSIPCILVALLFVKFYIPATRGAGDTENNTAKQALSYGQMMRNKIYVASMLITIFGMGAYLVSSTYIPSFLGTARSADYTAPEQTLIMTGIGFGGILWGILAPALSDKIGRRTAMVLAYAIAMVAPVALLFLKLPSAVFAVVLTLTYAVQGPSTLAISVLPGDCFDDPGTVAKGIGLNTSVGEIVGGVGFVLLAGVFADSVSPSLPIWMAIVFIGIALLFSFAMPRKNELKKVDNPTIS